MIYIKQEIVNVLIDYDNLEIQNISDTKTMIDHILNRVFSTYIEKKEKIRYKIIVRLYGGWYEQDTLTRKAQELTSFLQHEYPDYNEKINSSIIVELSRSLASRPTFDLLFTYRKRQGLGRIKVCRKEDICCQQAHASISFFKKLKKHKRCPHCAKLSSELIWVSEQKLVDVMLAMDIAYFAHTEKDSELVLVSSDDDFLPALFQISNQGKKVIHMHAKPDHLIREEYTLIAPNDNYCELQFEEDKDE